MLLLLPHICTLAVAEMENRSRERGKPQISSMDILLDLLES